ASSQWSPGRCGPDPPRYSRDSGSRCRVECTRHSLPGCARAGSGRSQDGATPSRSTAALRGKLFWSDGESVESGRGHAAYPRAGGAWLAKSDGVHGRTWTQFWNRRKKPYNQLSADGEQWVNWLSQPWGPPQTAPSRAAVNRSSNTVKSCFLHWSISF